MHEEPIHRPHAGPPGEGAAGAEKAGDVIDRYTLVDELGKGGMGTVWRANQTEPVRREVALKVIKLGMDTREVVARFEAERQALALMDHPHIAKVLDGGATETGRPFFVMELVEGAPITELANEHRLDLPQRLELFTEVCEAIQHAHHKGLIHRDIKPSNVLVSLHDGVPIPKVIDFGIAKATSAELNQQTMLTQHAQVVGTPEYMAPEQADGSAVDIDTRADVYSLGVLLYELLTGTKPFDMRTVLEQGYEELLRTIREVDPAKPSTRVSTIAGTDTPLPATPVPGGDSLSKRLRGDLDWIVMKAIEKDRDRRYATPGELADDVRRYLDDQPVLAAPPSAAYRWRKFVRRRKKTVAAVGAIAFLLVAGSVGTGIGLWRTIQANKKLDTALFEKGQALTDKTRALADKEDALGEKERAFEERGVALADRTRALEEKTDALTAKEQALADLELVSRFQADQFLELDAYEMGLLLRQSLIDATPDEQRADLTAHLDRLNWTDLALRSLQETFFDRSLATIDERFADQTEVRTELLQTLADTLQKLGLFERAREPMERALALRREELGDLHPDTLLSVNRLGTLVAELGDLEGAEAHYREAWEGRVEVLGEDHRDTLKSSSNLALCLTKQGRYAEAEPVQRDCLARRRRALGEEDRETLVSMNNLGLLLADMGQLDEAEDILRDTVEIRRAALGDDDLSTVASISTLAQLLADRGDLEGGVLLQREALETTRRTLGNDHSRTLSSINNLAGTLRKLGRLDEAEPLYREANEGMRRVLGEDHYLTAISTNNLAGFIADQGRFDQAEPLFREAIACLQSALGPTHATTLGVTQNLAGRLKNAGRPEEAEPLYWRALEGLYPVLGNEHRTTKVTFRGLAGIYQARRERATEAGDDLLLAETLRSMGRMSLLIENHDDAAELFADALLQFEECGAPEPTILRTRMRLGEALAGQGEYAEAEPLLVDSATGLLDEVDLEPDEFTRVIECVVRLYDAWARAAPDVGHEAEAERWRVRLDDASADPEGGGPR